MKNRKKKRPLNRRDQLEKALGAAQREQYLQDNPHGYSRNKSVHKDKKQYSRKRKNRKDRYSSGNDGLFIGRQVIAQISKKHAFLDIK